jgi:DNA-binding NarL/FixJ family response regulator
MKKITVVLTDDHMLVRQGLKALLKAEPDMEVIGEAENGKEAVQMVKKLSPDVVVMDLAMPQMNGMDATKQILKSCPGTRILVLTSYNDEQCVDKLLEAGACGYLIKQTAAEELPRAIREVRRGNSFFSPEIAKRLRDQGRAAFNNGQRGDKPELTEREVEVLEHIAAGMSNQEIADKLGISIKTVEKHRQQVMNKLNIHETAGLTRYAISNGYFKVKLPAAVQEAAA